MTSHPIIAAHFAQSLNVLTRAAADAELLKAIGTVAAVIADAIHGGKKVLIAGNGGSAADAQHIAAELVGRYRRERDAFAAIALTTDTSALTSIANDYGFDHIFARQVWGLGRSGDVLMAISTSGRSPNILAAAEAARAAGMIVVGMTGANGGNLRSLCDHLIAAPSDETSIIQQIHIVAAHAICDAVERAADPSGDS